MRHANQQEQTGVEQPAPFTLRRLGMVMQPDPDQAAEQDGVTNPAVARGRDGHLYLLPRLVSKGNYSRVGLARVLFHEMDIPRGVERLGLALEPQASYEMGSGQGAAGCEDPRVTFVEPLSCYVMAYVAVGPQNAHVALAVSDDLFTWQRLGRVEFQPDGATPDMSGYFSKDAAFFPRPVIAPDGRPALALLHRPEYDARTKPASVADPRPSIWISYCPLPDAQRDRHALTRLSQHHVLVHPEAAWEAERIGAGTPPVLTPLGWLLVYHGVAQTTTPPLHPELSTYAAGILILDVDDPRRVLFRSHSPILMPATSYELEGARPKVVFPTGVDVRDERVVDIYYGMANERIGAARLTVPAELPSTTSRL